MTNSDKLRKYKIKYGLTTYDVAKMLNRSPITVNRWLFNADSHYHSPMPDNRLQALEGLLVDMVKV